MLSFLLFSVLSFLFVNGIGSQTTPSPEPLWKKFTPYPFLFPELNSSKFYKTINESLTNSGEAPIPLPSGLETEDWMYPCYNRSISNSEVFVVFYMKSYQMYCLTFTLFPTMPSNYTGRTMEFTLNEMVRVEYYSESLDRCKYQKSYVEQYWGKSTTVKAG